MKRDDDVVLIRKILSGDDAAFDILVKKYQESIHSLAWRKIRDFHYAEDIMQDTFLKAYNKLPTLKIQINLLDGFIPLQIIFALIAYESKSLRYNLWKAYVLRKLRNPLIHNTCWNSK